MPDNHHETRLAIAWLIVLAAGTVLTVFTVAAVIMEVVL